MRNKLHQVLQKLRNNLPTYSDEVAELANKQFIIRISPTPDIAEQNTFKDFAKQVFNLVYEYLFLKPDSLFVMSESWDNGTKTDDGFLKDYLYLNCSQLANKLYPIAKNYKDGISNSATNEMRNFAHTIDDDNESVFDGFKQKSTQTNASTILTLPVENLIENEVNRYYRFLTRSIIFLEDIYE